MNITIRVGERALDGKDGGISSLLPRGVITASVTTLGLHVRNGEVLVDQSLIEVGQLRVSIVRDDADFLSSSLLDPSGHVELAHGDDVDTTGFVILGDGLRTQETSFLNMPIGSAHTENRNGGRTSAEYQWNSTVRLGLKPDSSKAL